MNGELPQKACSIFSNRDVISKKKINESPDNFPDKIEIFTDEPVFDGQYSNQCYQNRIREAYAHLQGSFWKRKAYENWKYLVFHLPYAFHGKRVFTEIYSLEKGLKLFNSGRTKSCRKI